MLQGLAKGLELVSSGEADAICFAPLKKSALRLGVPMDSPEKWTPNVTLC